MPIKLYLSQANQARNLGPGGYTEKAGCAAITRATAKLFAEDRRFRIKRNSTIGIDTASRNIAEANAWGADRYVAVHTNAGMKGTICFYYSGSPKGKQLAEAIFRSIAKLSPGNEIGDRVQPHNSFKEIGGPKAPAVLVELEAHDWRAGTDWLTGNVAVIARALYEGICRGCDLKPAVAVKPSKVIKLRDKTLTIRRQLRPHRAGWYNLGLRPFYRRLVLQGDGDRCTVTPLTLTIPVPEKRPWWWKRAVETRIVPVAAVPAPPTPGPQPGTKRRPRPINFLRMKK